MVAISNMRVLMFDRWMNIYNPFHFNGDRDVKELIRLVVRNSYSSLF